MLISTGQGFHATSHGKSQRWLYLRPELCVRRPMALPGLMYGTKSGKGVLTLHTGAGGQEVGRVRCVRPHLGLRYSFVDRRLAAVIRKTPPVVVVMPVTAG